MQPADLLPLDLSCGGIDDSAEEAEALYSRRPTAGTADGCESGVGLWTLARHDGEEDAAQLRDMLRKHNPVLC